MYRKSSFSWGNGECVEVEIDPVSAEVRVRDSKDKDGPVLTFTPQEWDAFLRGAEVGEFDVSVE